MYKYHDVFETFEANYVLACSFSVQVNGEENFKRLFVTEARNLGESILIFFEQTDNWTLRHLLNLVTNSL